MKCSNADCGAWIEPDTDDSQYSGNLNAWYCWACYESMTATTSYVVLVNAGAPMIGYRVSGFATTYEDGSSLSRDDSFGARLARSWLANDGYRGRFVTKIDGWSSVVSGWTTGSWGDDTADRKQLFNDWAHEIMEGMIIAPTAIVLAFDPTSNVFSTRASVLVRDEDEETFVAFLGDRLADLRNALS